MAYEDVPVCEAADLARTLPNGSMVAASLDPARAWPPEQERAASVIDAMWAVATWMGGGRTQAEAMRAAPRVVRPGEREAAARRAEARAARVRAVRERIEETEWEEDDG